MKRHCLNVLSIIYRHSDGASLILGIFLETTYDLHRIALDKEVRSLNYKIVPCPLDELASSQLHLMHDVNALEPQNSSERAETATWVSAGTSAFKTFRSPKRASRPPLQLQ